LIVPCGALLLARPLGERALSWILKLTALALLASVAKAGWQFFVLGQQAFGFLRNPIYYAYNLLPAFVFFCEFALRRWRAGNFGPAAGAATAGLCLAGLVFSMGRTTLACAVLYFAIRIFPRVSRKLGLARALVIPVLFAIALVGAYRMSAPLQEKFHRSFRSNDPSRVGREIAWKYNFELFEAHPFFGVGPEKNGIDVARMPQYAGHWQPGVLIFAHSVYLQTLAEAGLVGFVLLLGYFASLALLGGPAGAVIVVSALAALTENTLNNSKAAHALYFYILLALWLDRRRALESEHVAR
jgi:O-antigen ligase